MKRQRGPEIDGNDTTRYLKYKKKARMECVYKDCVLADVHASAIDEFRVKMDDNMKEAINKAVDSRQFAKLCETLYIEAYECMKKEIDYMFAELKFEGAGARRRSTSNDYVMSKQERVGKRNAERQAKLDSSEKLERNFNCKNPQKFWKTSVQKESDQKSPAAVEPMMNSSNNLVFRPKVEGTIAEEVQNQSAQKTMDSVCSDAQNLNDGAPEKKNEQTGKEGKAPAQSSQQGSSSQSTPRAERAERSRNYTYMQNLQRQREEENAQKSLGFFFDFSEYLDGPNGLEGLLEPRKIRTKPGLMTRTDSGKKNYNFTIF
ncbi:hypothetical protein L3Y34_009826 [Caenorhabditis briggsae]|uniref:Uncharacterized protein n=1 Tax=Caenorhabditis briggsae TaxID=6238 RepID=A0AAE9D3F7_CAEBR|nr:hypothetical protein L3Y34_009826 [Caenorhabditis briggsae]